MDPQGTSEKREREAREREKKYQDTQRELRNTNDMLRRRGF